MKALVTLIFAASAMFIGHSVVAENCGKIKVAEMNWPSAELMANVDKLILEKGFDCDVELVAGATTTTFASMNEKGQPDLASELWVNALRVPLKKALNEGRLHTINRGPITELGEGWWIPPHTVKKHPELKTVLDVLKRPELFPHPEDKSKGGFVTCPAGWGCQLTNANLYRAFEMKKKGWRLVDPGSSAGLDGSMAKAMQRGENWFGYYWSPTAMIGKFKMKKLSFGVPFAGSKNWDGCIVKPEQECANPKPSAWTKSEVHSVITDRFMKRGGAAITYLKNRVFPGSVMNAMLVYMSKNQASGQDAAIEFLQKQRDIWGSWISPKIAKKIESVKF
ncbi:MAG: ABC transporter substrate-binding protein [Rhodospirillaceae bacterium]|nr:ABC transporter substrate-binding protein [Rhodospirillaceae bacterium]|tara:strand:- start:370 stop:1377 length:1008 start_codon:yes stop_codon:yes gene_type:complete